MAKISVFKENLVNFGFEVGTFNDLLLLKPQEKYDLFLVGVLSGAWVILFASLFYHPALLLFIPYLFGCKHDLKQMKAIKKTMVKA